MTESIKDRFSKLLFYVLIIVTGYLTYRVLSPFLAPLAWAAVFAMMFQGVHRELTGALWREPVGARDDAAHGRAHRCAGESAGVGPGA